MVSNHHSRHKFHHNTNLVYFDTSVPHHHMGFVFLALLQIYKDLSKRCGILVVLNDIHGMASLLWYVDGEHLIYNRILVVMYDIHGMAFLWYVDGSHLVYNGILVVIYDIHGMAFLWYVDGGHLVYNGILVVIYDIHRLACMLWYDSVIWMVCALLTLDIHGRTFCNFLS